MRMCVSSTAAHTHMHAQQQLLTLVFSAIWNHLAAAYLFIYFFDSWNRVAQTFAHAHSWGWWLGNILPINCSSEVPPAAQQGSRHREILVCPLHLPIQLRHTLTLAHTPPHTLNPYLLSLIRYSSLLSLTLAYFSPSPPTPPFPLALLSSVTPDQKDLDPTWNRETLEGYTHHFPGATAYKDRTNRLEKQKQSFSFPICITFSVSACPVWDFSFSLCFHLTPLCLLPCYILWNT